MTTLRDLWALDPAVTFLNHGSFGACPRSVLDHQSELRRRMEHEPVRFVTSEYDELLAGAIEESAAFVGADPAGYAFLPNATHGVNTLLRNAVFEPGDEILVTDHGYEAASLAAEEIAAERGVTVRTAHLPVPVEGSREVVESILAAVTPSTRLAMIDHVTSATALILPVAEIVAALAERGVETIVDGAHAPGMLPLDIDAIGCAAYTGNWHKWVCAPKGSAFVWMNQAWQERARPLVVSHGAGHAKEGQTSFRARFDWSGTADPTAYLSVPFSISAVAGMLPGGWVEVMDRNRSVMHSMRARVNEVSGLVPTGPESMVGSMAAFTIGPPVRDPFAAARALHASFSEHGVVVGVSAVRASKRLQVRLSAHLHTDESMVEPFLAALAAMGTIRDS
ncbi:MAG: aminotransferase class V-fold PLP-dependent enzyme [Acidimicrobiia bacterium]